MLRYIVLKILMLVIIFILLRPEIVLAEEKCNAVVIPDELSILTQKYLTFVVTNTGDSKITGLKISTPSSHDMPVTGRWSPDFRLIEHTKDYAIFTEGLISSGQKATVYIDTQTGFDEMERQSWTVEGIGEAVEPIICSGYTMVGIRGLPKDTRPPQLGIVDVEILSQTSVRISWVTDKLATSGIVYGRADGRDNQILTDEDYIYNHDVILRDLAPGAKYVYFLYGNDEQGNEGKLETDTFTIPEQEEKKPVPLVTEAIVAEIKKTSESSKIGHENQVNEVKREKPLKKDGQLRKLLDYLSQRAINFKRGEIYFWTGIGFIWIVVSVLVYRALKRKRGILRKTILRLFSKKKS